VHTRDEQGRLVSLFGRRVFMAAGAVNSTAIVLRSLPASETEVTLRDSNYFLFPMLSLSAARRPDRERLHTLAQVFLEVMDNGISPYTVHFQCYSYNDLYEKAFEGMFGRFLFRLIRPLLAPFIGRLWIAQAYVHSAHSSSMRLSLEAGQEGPGRVRMRAVRNGEGLKVMRRAVLKLLLNVMKTGMIPVLPVLKGFDPGKGFHYGGSFPMRAKPGESESDVLGRPFGLQRVHVVDASVFPSFPATTVTFTIMANAHRIGMETGGLDT
jgi:hypothetical protein